MRDRRPAATAAGTAQETANNEKLKDVNLTAKTDIVYEEPGDEKSIFRRVQIRSILSLPLTTGRRRRKATELRGEKEYQREGRFPRCPRKSVERNKSLRRQNHSPSRRKPPRRMTNW